MNPGDVFITKMVIKETFMDLEQAREMIARHGYLEALRLSEEMRDKSSCGTTTFALWNDTVKQLKKAATVGKLER